MGGHLGPISSNPLPPTPLPIPVKQRRPPKVSPVAKLIKQYTSFVRLYPVVSNVLQGLILFSIADIAAQVITNRSANHPDAPIRLTRILGAAIFGSFYSGLLITSWIRFLDSILPSDHGVNAKVVLKVILTIFAFGLVGNGANVYVRQRVTPSPHHTSFHHTLHVMPAVFLNDLKLFPVADLICYSAIKPEFRPAFTGVVSLCWNTYISIVANEEH